MHSKWLLVLALFLNGSVRAQLTAKNAYDIPCSDDIDKYLATNINLTRLAMTKNYYVPMGSQAFYRHFVEVLLGRPLASYRELSQMQLRIKFSNAVVAISKAFPKKEKPPYFTRKCAPNIVGPMSAQVVCKPTCGSSTANLRDPAIITTVDSLVYWFSPNDNEITFISVRCPSDGIQDYEVLSTNKTISEPMKSRILRKIQEIGFDLNKLYYMQYD